MAVFAETKLQRYGIELSTGFRVIKDRRTNPSYSQHASLVYMPVPTKKISYAPGGAGGVGGSQLQWRRMRSRRSASWRYYNISECARRTKGKMFKAGAPCLNEIPVGVTKDICSLDLLMLKHQ
ncbi:hypothetical protein ACQJBY_015955 [Aegilops geniculata]